MQNRNKKHSLLSMVAIGVCLVLAALALLAGAGFLAVLLLLGSSFMVCVVFCTSGTLRVLAVNIGAVFLIFSCIEAYFLAKEFRTASQGVSIRQENVYLLDQDPLLGWKLRSDTSWIARKYADDHLVYSARITVDSQRLRISAPCIGECAQSVLFFGNSCTFGEGLHDSLTLPYQFGVLSDFVYKVYNFGVSGYGPHHMLSQIQSGMVEKINNEEVKHVVYQTLYPEHVYRLCGFYDWNLHSPRFLPDASGQLVHTGQYEETRDYMAHPTGLLAHSKTLNSIMTRPVKLTKREKELYVAMILTSKELLDQMFDEPLFHLVLWDWSDGSDKALFEQLRNHGVQIHDAKSIFTDDPASLKYRISRFDTHPNGYAYNIIASYLLDRIQASIENQTITTEALPEN